ncbi:putative methyltransferase [Lachnellula suecica]|uniref:Putative methyltransferase n=1 Tax=Lachnellula suecica TaxID=602035 RepID=A0A8T9C2H0_9HELO|nr:putative methyltransferase [Lachnellula suecica]
MASTTPKVNDPTFRSYSADQAKVYASHRAGYNAAIYKVIFDHHTAAGGHYDLVLDCGCGPGNATRELALKFDQAIGVDAGSSMIERARAIGGKTKSGADIKFELATGETFSKLEGLEPGSVDMLTVASMDFLIFVFTILYDILAVHWFEMDKFYAEAAKVLKPGGTLALWTRGKCAPTQRVQLAKFVQYPGFHVCFALALLIHLLTISDPDETNSKKLKEIVNHFEYQVIRAFEEPGNRLSRDLYDKLPLPWNVSPPVSEFSKANFVKHDYDRDGVLSNGKSFFGGEQATKLGDMEKALATSSMVTRWKEANPDLAGTEKDCVKVVINQLREALGGKDECLLGPATTILLFNKSA